MNDDEYFADLVERLPATRDDDAWVYYPADDAAGWVEYARAAYGLDARSLPTDKKSLQVQERRLNAVLNVNGWSPSFHALCLEELSHVENMLQAGDERVVRGFLYVEYGSALAAQFESCGLPSPNAEAATFLWHAGGQSLASVVIDPYGRRAKESRGDPLESTAKKRWRSSARPQNDTRKLSLATLVHRVRGRT